MYRILRPNGQWITQSLGLELTTLEGAVKYAEQFARNTQEEGEFLIYKDDDMHPSGATRLLPLIEDED